MLNIRKAIPSDAEALHDLYHNHLTQYPPKEPQDMKVWREKIEGFFDNPLYHLLVGEAEGRVVSSVTLVIVENLTHNQRPYGIIENVVTHSDFRGKHYATALMNRASEIAKDMDCYKIMLMTGSKKASTLRFYENCGYTKDKTAFQKRFSTYTSEDGKEETTPSSIS